MIGSSRSSASIIDVYFELFIELLDTKLNTQDKNTSVLVAIILIYFLF